MRDRGIAFGIWGSVIGGMAAIGPLIGGWLTTNASWRWATWLRRAGHTVIGVDRQPPW